MKNTGYLDEADPVLCGHKVRPIQLNCWTGTRVTFCPNSWISFCFYDRSMVGEDIFYALLYGLYSTFKGTVARDLFSLFFFFINQ